MSRGVRHGPHKTKQFFRCFFCLCHSAHQSRCFVYIQFDINLYEISEWEISINIKKKHGNVSRLQRRALSIINKQVHLHQHCTTQLLTKYSPKPLTQLLTRGCNNTPYGMAILGVGLGDLSIKRILSAWGGRLLRILAQSPSYYTTQLNYQLLFQLLLCVSPSQFIALSVFVWSKCTGSSGRIALGINV